MLCGGTLEWQGKKLTFTSKGDLLEFVSSHKQEIALGLASVDVAKFSKDFNVDLESKSISDAQKKTIKNIVGINSQIHSAKNGGYEVSALDGGRQRMFKVQGMTTSLSDYNKDGVLATKSVDEENYKENHSIQLLKASEGNLLSIIKDDVIRDLIRNKYGKITGIVIGGFVNKDKDEVDVSDIKAVIETELGDEYSAAVKLAEFDNFVESMAKEMNNAKRKVDYETNTWDAKAKAGSIWHAIKESFFLHSNDRSAGQFTLDMAKDVINEYKKNNTDDSVLDASDASISSFLKGLATFRDSVLAEDPNAIFFPEVGTYNINKNIGQFFQKKKDADKIQGTVGFIDLLVAHEDGSVSIYDLKTSVHSYNDWNKEKDGTCTFQMFGYEQMQLNRGFKVRRTAFVPLHFSDVDFDKGIINSATLGHDGKMFFEINRLYLKDGGYKIFQMIPDETKTTKNNTKIAKASALFASLFGYTFDTTYKTKTPEQEAQFRLSKRTYKDSTGAKFVEKGVVYYDGTAIRFDVDTPYLDAVARVATIIKPLVSAKNTAYGSMPDTITSMFKQFREDYVNEKPMDSDRDGLFRKNMKDILSKYISDSNWELIDDQSALAFGILVFKNKTTNTYEFLNITQSDINKLIGEKGKSHILLDVRSSEQIRKITAAKEGLRMDENYGVLEQMKVYAYIMENKDVYSDGNIGLIQTVQLNGNQFKDATMEFNGALKKRWDLLMKYANVEPELKKMTWEPEFEDYSKTMMYYISVLKEGIVKENPYIKRTLNDPLESLANYFTREFDHAAIYDKIKKLEKFQDELLSLIDTFQGREPDELTRAKLILSQAIAQMRELEFVNEEQVDINGNYVGTQNLKWGNPSMIMNKFIQNVRAILGKVVVDSQQLYMDFISEDKSIFDRYYKGKDAMLHSIGHVRFDHLLEKDSDGKITGKLKDPSEHVGLSKQDSDFIESFCTMINRRRAEDLMETGRYATLESALNTIKSNGQWYMMPLMRKSLMTAFTDGDYKSGYKRMKDYIFNPDSFQEDESDSKTKDKNRSLLKMRSSFDISEPTNPEGRSNLLTELGDDVETELEVVLRFYLYNKAKVRSYNKYRGALVAIRSMAELSDRFNFTDQTDILDWIDKSIDYVIKGKKDIDKGSEGTEIAMRATKMAVTYMALGFNAFAFITEPTQGVIASMASSLSNTISKVDNGYASTANLGKAMALITAGQTSAETRALLNEIDRRFGITDRTAYSVIAKQHGGRYSAMNFDEFAFKPYSMSDFYFRMSISVAKLIEDGVLKLDVIGRVDPESALSIKNGVLKYDPSKDERFKEYLNNKTQNPDTASNTWHRAKLEYETRLEELAKNNPLMDDDSYSRMGPIKYRNGKKILNIPYTSDELLNMHELVDRVYGYVSPEQKAEGERSGLGGMFIHFKTWARPTINRFTEKPGLKESLWKYKVVYDENGKPVRMDKIPTYGEGIVYTFQQVFSDLKDTKSLIEAMKGLEPEQLENLSNLIMKFMVYILATTATSASGLKLNEMSNLQARSVKAFYKGMSDSNPLNTVASMAGIGPNASHPLAAIGSIGDLLYNGTALITGDLKLNNFMTRSFGVYRSVNTMITMGDSYKGPELIR